MDKTRELEKHSEQFMHNEVKPWIPPPDIFRDNQRLKYHQCVGISWMQQREIEGAEYTRGGILMDEAGLGKTIQMLTLCKINPCIDRTVQGNTIVHPTLIVCPTMLINTWIDESVKWFGGTGLRISKYYGPQRCNVDIDELMNQNDIIITSYSCVCKDWDKEISDFIPAPSDDSPRLTYRKGSLFRRWFGRIILDEAHNIRNMSSLKSRATTALLGTRLWCVTATPIFNRIDDLYPIFSFLGISPFVHDKQQWKNTIVRKIESSPERGFSVLFSYLTPITLRRTKSVLELPLMHHIDVFIDFSDIERDFYDSLYLYAQSKVKVLLGIIEKMKRIRTGLQINDDSDDIMNSHRTSSTILTLILRLRQACVSPLLVINSMIRLQESKSITEAMGKLKETNVECELCLSNQRSYELIPCKHECCEECYSKMKRKIVCPICRVKVVDLVEIPKSKQPIDNDQLVYDRDSFIGAKIDWIIHHLSTHNEKSIIASQWTAALDILEQKICNIKYIRLDGRTNPQKRHEIIRDFQSNDSIRLCILSLGSTSEGITMTAATVVYHLDLWWNDSVEYQMSNRIHRIGQENNVSIYHIYANNTIESCVKKMKDMKALISAVTFDESLPQSDMGWINDVRLMFNLDDHENQLQRCKRPKIEL